MWDKTRIFDPPKLLKNFTHILLNNIANIRQAIFSTRIPSSICEAYKNNAIWNNIFVTNQPIKTNENLTCSKAQITLSKHK